MRHSELEQSELSQLKNGYMIGKNFQNRRGIALLMSVLVSSIFFVIAAAVFKIAFIEYTLSSTGKDSQFAFYAADTGAECALYWDSNYPSNGLDSSGSAFNVGAQAVSSDPVPFEDSNRQRIIAISNFTAPQLTTIKCLGSDVVSFSQANLITDTKFELNSGSVCSSVEVQKRESSGSLVTTIISKGYNTCNTASPRRVERTLKVTIE